ncbi:MAG: hypothetical protein FJ293_12230 [Planctomycetes bacterium]|nr:hypothetical protein [Planctomycetota bacterium]
MSGVTIKEPQGVLRSRWSASVDDYAIAGGWALRGDAIVVADSAGGVHAFDGTTGRSRWSRRDTHPGGLLAIAIRSDTVTLATAGQDGCVRLWSIEDGEPRRSLPIADGWVERLEWSPNGDYLAASCRREVRVFSAAGEEVWRSPPHPSTVSALQWLDPRTLASACYGRVTMFRIPNGSEARRFEWKGSLVSMVHSPDGDVIACGSQDNSVHFWRRTTGKDSMMSGYEGKPAALAFDDSGTLLATGGGVAVTVWSFAGRGPEGTRPGELEMHVLPIMSLTFAPRSMRLASGARDGAVVVWALEKSGRGKPIGVVQLQHAIAGLHWHPDGEALVALDAGGGVVAWRVEAPPAARRPAGKTPR